MLLASKPSSPRISSVCSPRPGARLGRNLRDTMHLDRTADRRGQLATRTFERNDDPVRRQLRIVDHLLRSADLAKGDVHAGKNRMPMRHGLSAEHLVKDGRELRHVRDELRRLGEARIGQQVRAADCIRDGRKLVRRDDENEPGSVGSTIDVHRGIGRMLAVVHRWKLGAGESCLNGYARGPHALGKQRRRDIRAFTGPLAPIERGDDRRIEADSRGIVAAAAHRPGGRCAGVARHR